MPQPSSLTVAGLLAARATADPDRAAVVFAEGSLSYRELADATRRAAARFVALGVRPGDVLAILSDGDQDTVVALLAAARIGAVCLPVNNRFRAGELRHVIDNGDARVLLTSPRFTDEVRAALPGLPGTPCLDVRIPEAPTLRHVADLSDSVAGVGDGAGVRVGVDPNADRLAGEFEDGVTGATELVMIYTSGTTARPRGCLHSHAGYLRQGADIAEKLRLRAEDRFWTPLPFFHVGGYDVLFASLQAGATMVHSGPFEPGRALAQLAGQRCTVAFPAFETIWLPVLRHPGFADADLSALRTVVNVGAPERMEAMQRTLPNAIQISCTGSTESAGFCCIGSLDDPPEMRARTSGRVNSGMEARVVDVDTGESVADGIPGEFVFRGSYRLLRYHRDPDLTAARIDRAGWYHSGDQVVRDGDGRYTYLGRLGDVLKVGGENVSPTEVEGHLSTHPAVNMVQVVGAPDARYGQVPAAFVMPHEGADVTERDIIEHCLDEIATFKVPRYVFFVDEWPMSGTKIQKFALRERVAAHLATRGITEAPRLSSARHASASRSEPSHAPDQLGSNDDT